MEKKPYVRVTENLFKVVKILTEGGATIPEIVEYTKLGKTTVSNIRAAESFEDYKQMIAAYKAQCYAKKKGAEEAQEAKEEPKIVEHKQNITIQATHFMMQELQKTNELLTTISAKLAFIVDELTK